MKTDILISIITINYNDKEGLDRTFKSVINQNWKEFEHIIIDGGSTDGSEKFVEDNSSFFSYCVSEPDKGIYHAMNKGIKQANGDFLIFLNSGDVFFNHKVLDNLKDNIMCDFDEIVYGDVLLRNEKTDLNRIQKHPENLTFNYFFNQTICHQSCVFKRELFDRIFYFNETYKIVSDWEFLIYAIFKKGVKIRKTPVIVSIFDTTGISSNQEMRGIANKEREEVLRKYFPLLIDDYKKLNSYSSKRSKQLLYIEKSVFFRKVVSVFFLLILLFMPKEK
jgi:glycosyltransferase involved in cell wall biosynthesis